MSIIRNFIAKGLFKKSGVIANREAVDFSTNALIKRLENYNIKPTDITSEDQLLKVLNGVKQAEDNMFNNRFRDMMENNKFFNKQSDNVVDLKNRKLNTEKPILGGTQETDEQILKRLKKQNEDSINRLKNKKDPPEELAGGGVAGLLGERPGYEGGLRVGAPNPKILELMLNEKMSYEDALKEFEKREKQRPYIEERMGTGPGPILEAADGGPARPGYQDGNGVADEDAEKAALGKRVRQLMDEGFDMGEAVRKAMSEGYADGGRTGFRGGGMDMGNASNQAQSASMGGGGGGGNARERYRTQQYKKSKTTTSGGGGGGKTTTTTTPNNTILNKIIARNKPGKSPLEKFLAHDKFTDRLKESKIPNYHQLGGFDFMARFPDTNPNLAKFLGSTYQNISEGARALTNKDISFADAMNKAAEESRLNAIGIDAFSDPNSKTYKTYSEGLIPEIMGNVQMADGGPARQNFSMGKRAFLKLMGGVGAGIAGLKSGLLGLGGKQATKKAVTEVATSAGSGTPPPYFFKLVEKIKTLGDDAPKLAVKDREVVTKYKDYTLTEDITTGEKTIQRMKIDDDLKYDASEYYGKPVGEDVYMNYKPGKSQADETMKGKTPRDEYTEDTSLIRSDRPAEGEIMDTFDGVPDDILEEVGETIVKKADGGRIGYAVGKKVIAKGIMSKINKLFGKGTMTTADKIAQPEKTIQQRIMEFEARNKPDAITVEPRQILDVPPMPSGFSLSKEKLLKKFPELDESFADELMEMDKNMQGRIIKMLENRRKNPEAYDKLLDEKGDTLEFQGAFDEITRKSNNADGGRIGLSGGGGLLKLFKFLKPKPKKLETVKSFLEKRQFLKDIVGNTEKNKKARELKMLKDAMEEARKNPGFKFENVDIDKDIRPIFDKEIVKSLKKNRKLNATGGLAAMLGE